MKKRTVIVLCCLLIGVAVLVCYLYGRSVWVPVVRRLVDKPTAGPVRQPDLPDGRHVTEGKKRLGWWSVRSVPPPTVPEQPPLPEVQKPPGQLTISQVVAWCGPEVEKRLGPCFQAVGARYPPRAVQLIALKEERRLELWASKPPGWVFVRAYDIKEASGKAGPKLRQGDHQVPEGLYRVVGLNPNSKYHVSVKLDYPNAFDWERAKADGRLKPGGDIFIHGKDVSVGCLAMGDEAAEELFVLISKVGIRRATVIIAPKDFRKHPPQTDKELPEWVPGLYSRIQQEMLKFPCGDYAGLDRGGVTRGESVLSRILADLLGVPHGRRAP